MRKLLLAGLAVCSVPALAQDLPGTERGGIYDGLLSDHRATATPNGSVPLGGPGNRRLGTASRSPAPQRAAPAAGHVRRVEPGSLDSLAPLPAPPGTTEAATPRD